MTDRRFSEIDLPSRFRGALPGWLVQALVGFLCCLVSIGLRAVLDQFVTGVIPFALLFPAVLVATLLAGWVAGAWTTALGGLAVWYFLFDPQRSFAGPAPNQVVSLTLFVASSALVFALADAYRRSARALARERAQQALLINELNHRVKNTLATVQSIAALTLGRRAPGDEAATAFQDRLFALARAHDVLTRSAWERAGLDAVVAQAMRPFENPGRIRAEGPEVRLGAQQVLGVSMALHELATNAVKHGALSADAGVVQINWAVEDGEVRLSWSESGGPDVKAPTAAGFGSRLLVNGLPGELDGVADLAFHAPGLVYTLRFRAAA